MDVPCLSHANSIAHFLPTLPSTIKAGAGPVKTGARPDFVGLAHGGSHIFESKGRSWRIPSSLMATALAQVSRNTSINGGTPTTRVACCFALKPTGVTGQIQDPEPDGGDYYELEFDEIDFLSRYYAFFLEDQEALDGVAAPGGYVFNEIGDGFKLGIDSKLLKLLRAMRDGRDSQLAGTVLQYLENRRDAFKAIEALGYSSGIDGIMLIGPSGFSRVDDQSPQASG
jgi:hypothetical protein